MGRTKIFFDTEFTGLQKHTTLISIGLISEDGRTFYAEFSDYNKQLVDKWIEENVIKNLRFVNEYSSTPRLDYEHHAMKATSGDIAIVLSVWLAQFGEIEIWSDCLSYDWVLFCDLFGGALTIPKDIYYIPFDICTLFKLKGIDPDIGREEFAEMGNIKKHNALYDAKVIRSCYNKLMN